MNRTSKWSEEEGQMLRQLRHVQKIRSWKAISYELNKNFPQKYRTPKQCREKYVNSAHFQPGFRRISDWTRQQDQALFDFYVKEGPKWGTLSQIMPGRSRNCLKNRFYGLLRKLVRKLNGIKSQQKRKRRLIRYKSLIRVISSEGEEQVSNSTASEQNRNIATLIIEIKKEIIKQAIQTEDQQNESQLTELEEKLRRFSNLTKWYWMRKTKLNFNSFPNSENSKSNSGEEKDRPRSDEMKNQKESGVTLSDNQDDTDRIFVIPGNKD